MPAGARMLCSATNPQLVCCKAPCGHAVLANAHSVGADLGDVVDTEESFFNRFAVEVVTDFDGNAMLVGPHRVQFQGLAQVRQVLLANPLEVLDIGARFLDEQGHCLHCRHRSQGNCAGGETIAGLGFIGRHITLVLGRNIDDLRPYKRVLEIGFSIIGILRMKGVSRGVFDPVVVPLDLAVVCPLHGKMDGCRAHVVVVGIPKDALSELVFGVGVVGFGQSGRGRWSGFSCVGRFGGGGRR